MSGDFSLNSTDFGAVLVLACTPRVRSVTDQDRLVRVCSVFDAFLRIEEPSDAIFAALAGKTWEGRPCECGRVIPPTAEACGTCRRQRAAASLRDPLCTVTDPGHRCVNREGEPLRVGQSCWTTARRQVRGGS